MTTNKVESLRGRIAEAESRVQELRETLKPANERRAELSLIVDAADATMERLPAWAPDAEAAKSRKNAALAEYRRIHQGTKPTSDDIDRLLSDIATMRRDIVKAEAEAITVDERAAELRKIAASVKAIGRKTVALSADLEKLRVRQQKAHRQQAEIAEAEIALTDARDDLENAQGDAYISDQAVDLSELQTRVATAQRAVDDAREVGAAAIAALPKIAERIADLADELDALKKEREAKVAEWWTVRMGIAQASYKAAVDTCMQALQEVVAADQHVHLNVSFALVDSMRSGLKVPDAFGKNIEPVNAVPYFGADIYQLEVGAALNRMQSELSTAIGEEV